MKHSFRILLNLILLFLCFSCKETQEQKMQNAPKGMVWVAPKIFTQGAKNGDVHAMDYEKPAHNVHVAGFYIDATEITNKQFEAFVNATGYVTVAERPINWEVMKLQLPKETPKPHDSLLQPGSLIFNKNAKQVANMQSLGQWWTWMPGANWKHPKGSNSSIKGKENFPVVHVSYTDAIAYCKWANRRLPTEAEWESAAQGKYKDAIFTWGNNASLLTERANTWQGTFPVKNKSVDGFEYIAPVKSYEPNSIGIYDMAGNVWEMTSDFYNVNHYKSMDKDITSTNPIGASKAYNPNNPYTEEYVIKGGSFLCNASYCASYRISAKMPVTKDSSSDHTGFRTVATETMIALERR